MDEITVRAPGRVNLLGEHVDYNGGPVLPVAIDRYVTLRATRRDDGLVKLYAGDLNETVTVDLEALDARVDVDGKPLPGWVLYPLGVAWALRDPSRELPGMTALYRSTIPMGAGLSSSAAVEAAFALAWQALGGWEMDRMELAKLCQRAENEYVGVACGLMDQFAVLHGVAGHALLLDTRTLAWEKIPLPSTLDIVVTDSGIRRDLASTAYNDRRQSCEAALSILRTRIPELECLADLTRGVFATHAGALSEIHQKRVLHVLGECESVRMAVQHLKRRPFVGTLELMTCAHWSLRGLFDVSCPELDALVDIASGLPGCHGSKLTGAGFGGCTVSLVEWSKVDDFMRDLAAGYLKATGRVATIHACRAVDGARVVGAEE